MKKNILLFLCILLLITIVLIFIILNKNSNFENNQNIDSDNNITKKFIEQNETYSNNSEITNNVQENILIQKDIQQNMIEGTNKKVEAIIIKVNGSKLTVKLENNSSANALVEKLKDGNIIINAHNYGNFEKVGNLGFSLPTNDTQIRATAGDLMLYQGNQITLFYGSNFWSYTRLGKIIGISEIELKNILGDGDVTLDLSID